MKRILAIVLAALMLASLCACGGGSGDSAGKKTVTFMYGGSVEVSAMFKQLIEEFNATKGNELGINVKGVPKSNSLDSVLAQQLPSNSGPDVVVLQDEYFKKHTEYLEDLSTQLDAAVINDFYPNMLSRYHYNVDTTTSNSTDPLYAVPAYGDATVLYYNKTALEAVGVKCISVPADQIEAFNSGEADLNGNTKESLGITVDVPAKGYYRSEMPYVPMKGETDGSSWEKPSSKEILVFNDQIPMNWDEIEDLGMLCTTEHNEASKTLYGYYTEWWFNYVWSIGGDCIEDISGNGDWVYTLPSEVPNYIVNEGKTYTGLYTGTTYAAGETLNVKDVLEANAGDTIGVETDGKTYMSFTVNGTKIGARDFSAQIADGTLSELPSTVDAISRFIYLAGEGGMNVCPSPAVVGSSTPLYFTSGALALMVERVSFYSTVEGSMRDEWGIAPLPQYKVYEDALDPDNDTVVLSGKVAGHSHGYCVGVSVNAKAKDSAYAFVNWLSTDGQKYMAEHGFVSSRQSDRQMAESTMTQKNVGVILDAAAAALPGDWWYMPNRVWIDDWASSLNYSVRYGTMSLEDFLYAYIDKTNQDLAAFKK